MSDGNVGDKGSRKPKTIEDEIALAQEKLNKLKEKKRDQDRKNRERNQKGILELIGTEGIDLVPVEIWKMAVPGIVAALKQAGAEIETADKG